MAFDEELARRARAILAVHPNVSEKKMFGGLAFLISGNVCCGILGNELMVRVGPEAYEAALSRPHTRQMDFTGRPLRGYVYVSAEGLRTARILRSWIGRGIRFAESLPAK